MPPGPGIFFANGHEKPFLRPSTDALDQLGFGHIVADSPNTACKLAHGNGGYHGTKSNFKRIKVSVPLVN